jgi:hypothetical protein
MKRLLVTAVLAVASSSWADIPPPNLEACAGRRAGVSCVTEDGEAGSCQKSKCSRLDYSKGFPPRVVQYDCMMCVASASAVRATASTPAFAPTTEHAQAVAPAAGTRSNTWVMPGAVVALGLLLAGVLARRRMASA